MQTLVWPCTAPFTAGGGRWRALAGALTQPMEQLVAQLARWLIYKLLLSLTKMLLAAAVRPKVGVTAHVCIQ